MYPFNTHHGHKGKGDWLFGANLYFEGCQLLSGNSDISFTPDRTKAFVRSTYVAHWAKKKDEGDRHYSEGGDYYWVVRGRGMLSGGLSMCG